MTKLILVLVLLCLCNLFAAQAAGIQPLGGTLVVAIPVAEGLVACSDKRLHNDVTGKFTDNFVKIRKVNNSTLFVATHTVGFLDRTTGKMGFDVFEITSRYAARRPFSGGQSFWSGLKEEIQTQLLAYLGKRKFAEWPETDTANNKLLFNLIFYSVAGHGIRSYSLQVFYEKAQTPVIFIPGVVTEDVRSPQLSGKGKDVMDYLSRNPRLTQDLNLVQFDQNHFDINKVMVSDAVNFADKLFSLSNSALPQTEVSSTHDCALLSYQNGFQWINDSGMLKK